MVFTFCINEPGFSDENPAFAADPAPLGHNFTFAHWLSEMEVEAGCQEETIGRQRVRGIEGSIVKHLEIDRAMRCTGRVVILLADREDQL